MSEASGIELADEVHLGLKPPVDSPPERGAFVRVYGQMMSAIDTAARVGLFFALCQFPLFLSPFLLRPIYAGARRWGGRKARGAAP